jgi:NitT/TauT family transport system substrate-binding protein
LFRHWPLLALLLGALFGAGQLAGCADKPQETLRVSGVLWPGYEPLYLAGKLGYLDEQKIRLIDFLSNTDAMLAFRNHNLEAGAFTLDEVLRLLADGMDIEVILVMDISDGGDVIMANPGIESVEALHGRRIAVEDSAVGGFVLTRALQVHGLDLGDVIVVPLNAMEQQEAFRAGKVDAAVSFDPYRTQLLKDGKREIFNSREIPDEIVDVLVVRRDYSQRHPETVRRLVTAWFRALAYQSRHPRKSAAYSSHRFSTTVDDYLAGLKRLRFPTIQDNRQLLDSERSPLVANAQRFGRVLAKMHIQAEGIDIRPRLSPAYLP